MISGSGFVNLHNHSDYSILDGYSKPGEYLRRASAIGQHAFALTDHGNLYGAFDLVKTARDLSKSTDHAGHPQDPIYVKPIVGIEAYMAPENPDGALRKEPVFYSEDPEARRRGDDVSANGAYCHLTLISINDIGFHNLIRLSTESFLRERRYRAPRMDMDLLSRYSDGIVVLTGCPSGEIQTRFRLGQDEKAYEYARRLKEMFPERCYVEVMSHHMRSDTERRVIPKLRGMAADLDLPMVVTNDAHFASPDDVLHHDEMLCIQTNARGGGVMVIDANGHRARRPVRMTDDPIDAGGPRFAFDGDDYWLKTEREVRKSFPEDEFPHAVDNSLEIADMAGDWWTSAVDGLDVDAALADYRTRVASYESTDADESIPRPTGGVASRIEISGKGSTIGGETTVHAPEELVITPFQQDLIDREAISLGPYDMSLNPGLRPRIPIPKGWTEESWFAKRINDGFIQRRVNAGDPPEVLAESKMRISAELPTFVGNHFVQYMLVVKDYIDYARSQGIGVGYGRGSVGGSEIAYLLDISRTDPIRHDLLFERFLNPERRTPPDVDTDFQSSRRNEVLAYVKRFYGDDHVANIIAFGTFKCKQAFKGAARIYGMSPFDANRLSKLIPGKTPDREEPTRSAIYDERSPFWAAGAEFREELAKGGGEWAPIADAAAAIEGRITSTGTHPCGVIMSDRPISEIAPLSWNSSEKRAKDNIWVDCMVQWDYEACESLGLIKMDFLSLSDLDIVAGAAKTINDNRADAGMDTIDFDAIVHGSMDDRDTYEMLSRGDSLGVFQMGSAGIRKLLLSVRPTCFDDLVAINALFRPGPMGMNAHIEYANRKNGRSKPYVINEKLDRVFAGTPVEDVLRPTYGLIVYQEQVMAISRRLAGYSRGEADSLRKAIGHKIPSEMERNRSKFIVGAMRSARRNGYHYDENDLQEFWTYVQQFASYAFNKSHSAAYALTAYMTAYLKCHYPAAFYAAMMTVNQKKKDKIRDLMRSIRNHGLVIGSIDINASGSGITPHMDKTSPSEPDITFGFSSVAKISGPTADAIVRSRRSRPGHRWSSFDDFIRTVDDDLLRPAIIASLARVGAFESLGVGRRSIAESASDIVTAEKRRRRDRAKLAGSLLALTGAVGTARPVEVPDLPELPFVESMRTEKDLIGFYVSGTPLDHAGPGLSFRVRHMGVANLTTAGALSDRIEALLDQNESSGGDDDDESPRRITHYQWMPATIVGVLVDLKRREGTTWWSCAVQDATGTVGASMHSSRMRALEADLGEPPSENRVYIIMGSVDSYGSLKIEKLHPIDMTDDGVVPFPIRVDARNMGGDGVAAIETVLARHPGDVPAYFDIRSVGQNGIDYERRNAGFISMDEDALLDYERIISNDRMQSWSEKNIDPLKPPSHGHRR